MNINWSWLVACLIAVELIVQLWLMERQRRALLRHRDDVPAAFRAHLSLTEHQKASDYGQDKLRLSQLKRIYSSTVLVTLLWSGWPGIWDASLFDHFPHRVVQPLVFLALLSLGSTVLSLPWRWYSQFVLEARYGFNRSSAKIFWLDLTKSLVLGSVLGAALLTPMLWLMQEFPVLWVVMAFAIWATFQLSILWLWPKFIAPLFNRFTPLEDPSLVDEIRRLVGRAGFEPQGVFVMDASKRSGHGNAYFTGIGRTKRIVFFDTLLTQINAPQILAVLAHEIGHLKHGHVRKSLRLGLVFSAIGFAAVGWLQTRTDLYLAFGMIPTPASVLLMSSWLLPLIVFPLSPLFSWRSRKHEYEADHYAVTETSAQDLGDALLALHRSNAASVVNDPWYASFHFSHPPLSLRLEKMGYRG
jgi:STE24 endopeptidase